ncbi:MAG: hypothetical protein B7Z08_06195 [Sphingomonadales bacterium 32-68-7]|nr:MAG: hypothetical protein B7Z08_06195 [Sphingomonadales bacterium 32-68-7]
MLQERAGARTTFEVLDLLRDLLTVRSQLVAAETSAELARYGLLAAMGRLEAPQLVDGVVPYAPGDNLQRVRTMTDAPPITPMVEALDSIGIGRNTGPRPYRDPAAGIVPPGLATPADPATPTAD